MATKLNIKGLSKKSEQMLVKMASDRLAKIEAESFEYSAILVSLKEDKKMSLREIAKAIGTSKSTIDRYIKAYKFIIDHNLLDIIIADYSLYKVSVIEKMAIKDLEAIMSDLSSSAILEILKMSRVEASAYIDKLLGVTDDDTDTDEDADDDDTDDIDDVDGDEDTDEEDRFVNLNVEGVEYVNIPLNKLVAFLTPYKKAE